MASQVSLPSTPQQNTSYDTYMQSLQQKLSSISMQNASTLLHVDSSAPTSGTATTEMLSPVQETDAIQFPCSPPPSTTDTPKHTFKNLNNELTKINSRKESNVSSPYDSITNIEPQVIPQIEPQNEPQIELQASVAHTELPKSQSHSENIEIKEKPEKIRRISRFKVSVVAEPDPSKLIIKPEAKPELEQKHADDLNHTLKQVPSLQDIPSSLDNSENRIKIHDSVTLINNTMLQLQENVQTSYLSQAKSIIATVPSGWTTENQHAVGIPATIGNTAHVKIERKISMDNLKTRTTTTALKKSLSYNDLANEIANLFSKPSPKIPPKPDKITRSIDPVLTSSNPRKISGNTRRMSKTFRRTPTIIIHPPDETTDRITNSCPNIHALILRENGGVSTNCQNAHTTPLTSNKDELNHSCPDINILPDNPPEQLHIQSNLSRSCPDINTINDYEPQHNLKKYEKNYDLNYQKYEPLGISFSECLNELDALKNEVNDIKKECECLFFGCACDKPIQRNQFKHTTKRKISQKLLYKFLPNRPERKISPNKQDSYTRTVSEPNIFKNITKHSNYNRSFSEKSPRKHEITPTELLKHKIKQSLSMYDLNSVKQDDSYDNYVTIHGGMKFPKHLTDFTNLTNYKEPENRSRDCQHTRELDKDNNLLAIVKCCCGKENCQNGRLQVVPITFQQLMDFNCEYNMNETFEDMLGRQQAELNALIEAHRKQQIEYMKSITEVSKNSSSSNNSNRKDS